MVLPLDPIASAHELAIRSASERALPISKMFRCFVFYIASLCHDMFMLLLLWPEIFCITNHDSRKLIIGCLLYQASERVLHIGISIELHKLCQHFSDLVCVRQGFACQPLISCRVGISLSARLCADDL